MTTQKRRKTQEKLEMPPPDVVYRLLMARSAQIKSADVRDARPTVTAVATVRRHDEA
jgi:hypothetical protein